MNDLERKLNERGCQHRYVKYLGIDSGKDEVTYMVKCEDCNKIVKYNSKQMFIYKNWKQYMRDFNIYG